MANNIIVRVIDHRDRFVLPGQIIDGHLIVVVADDETTDATVLICAYEPDEEHGWTPANLSAMPRVRAKRRGWSDVLFEEFGGLLEGEGA